MKKLNVLTRMLLLVALLVGSVSAWGQAAITTADLTMPTPQFSENFNSLSTTSGTGNGSSATTLTNQTAFGIFDKIYCGKAANIWAIESNNTFDSNVLSLSAVSGSPVIASITGKTFGTKGAFSIKVLKADKSMFGLYSVNDNAAYAKANSSVYIQNTAGALSINDGSSGWVSIGTYTSNIIELLVVYNNTNSDDTYGDGISLASKKAHVYVNGTCVMNGANPKAFTIPGANLTAFRVLPQAANGNKCTVDDVVIYNALPTAASSVVAPTFTPAAGAVEMGTSVTISSTTEGSTIYYTTNGDEPSTSSSHGTAGAASATVTVSAAMTIKAIAVKDEVSSSTATAAYTIKKVVAPTFSIVSGTTVPAGTIAELETTTEGATIYYTTNGDEPTTSSAHGTAGTSSASVNISAAMTIRAIAVKDNWDNSDVASATYTVIAPIPGLAIDFEASSLNQYTDWTFNNIAITAVDITAHGGSKFGDTDGHASASITTKNKIEHPGLFTCYLSKKSNNTTASSWIIQVSSDGSSWTNAGSTSASSMTKGEWVEFTADLSEYSNVYVRLYYDGTSAIRAVDDIVLTESDAITVTTAGLATYASDYNLDFSGVTGIKAYKASISGKTITFTKMDEVPAGEGMLIRAMNDLGATTTFYVPQMVTSPSSIDNAMKRGEGTAVAYHPSNDIYNYVLSGGENGVGFYQANEEIVPTDRAYLQSETALAKGFVINYDDEEGEETDGIKAVSTKVENGVRYNLAGQKVGADYKGIVIVNGKKMLNK